MGKLWNGIPVAPRAPSPDKRPLLYKGCCLLRRLRLLQYLCTYDQTGAALNDAHGSWKQLFATILSALKRTLGMAYSGFCSNINTGVLRRR